MMHVVFELSMPNNNAWNNRWSGAGDLYARVLTVSDAKKTREKFEKLIGHHHYNFGDGWTACITVREVSGPAKRKLVKDSKGFYGYDWMIKSLRNHGKILNDLQVKQLREEKTNVPV